MNNRREAITFTAREKARDAAYATAYAAEFARAPKSLSYADAVKRAEAYALKIRAAA